MRAVPVYEAKNRFSELIAAAEQGEEVSITRRGVPVARLVAASPATDVAGGREGRVAAALACLRTIRDGVVLEGDIKNIARSGLD